MTTTGPLSARLRAALTAAMRERDALAMSTLRSTIGVIDNAGAVPADAPRESRGGLAYAGAATGVGATDVARRELTENEAIAIVRTEIEERRVAADGCVRAGRGDRAARLRQEADLLAALLEV